MRVDWYPVTAQFPPPVVRVFGETSCAVSLVSRAKLGAKDVWAEWSEGRPRRLDDSPFRWRPQHPQLWKADLPDPIPADQIATPPDGRSAPVRDVAWWRDASQVRYEPKGAITPHGVEGRIMRALQFSEDGYGDHIRTSSSSQILARFAAANADDHGHDPTCDAVPRMRMSRRDESDFLTAMSWYCALSRDDQMMLDVRARDFPMSFAQIGAGLGMTRQGAFEAYGRVIRRLCAIANGG